jgi:predicted PurR-regulated permease PerM
MNTRIEISPKTILFAIALIAGAWLLFQIREILYLLFIAFLLMTALHPLVSFLERFRIPRFLSVLIIYAVVLGVFGFSLVSFIPLLVTQSTHLAQALPGLVAKVLPYSNIDINTIGQQLAPIGENIIKVTVSIFSNIITTVAVLVFTFYFLLERRKTRVILTDMFGESIAARTIGILRSIEIRLGEWVRGELLLMLTIGVLVYIGLTVLRVDYALPIAILAGLLEIVPNIGPIISAAPAVLIGLATSPFLALSVVALYIIVHQAENNIVVPLIMKKSVGLSPLVTILALLIGGKLAGLVGAVLGVPVLLVGQVLFSKLVLEQSSKNDASRTKKSLNK